MSLVHYFALSALTLAVAVSGVRAEAGEVPQKEIAVRFLTQALPGNDAAFMKRYVAPDAVLHDPRGRSELKDFLQRSRQETTPIYKTVRVLQDGAFVAVHGEVSGKGKAVAFDVFRFAGERIVEYWRIRQQWVAKTVSGRSQTDGPVKVTEREKTADNKALVRAFVTEVLLGGENKLAFYLAPAYRQHNPGIGDNLDGLGAFIRHLADNRIKFAYTKLHRVIGEGNFVLTISEGDFGDGHMAFYDLFRVENGKLAEHWDAIAPMDGGAGF